MLPVTIKISGIAHGEKYGDGNRKIPFQMICFQKEFLNSYDQFQQLITGFKGSQKHPIQLAEATDISNMTQLLLYVRYVYERSIHEDLLFCNPFEAHTRGENIYLKVYGFLIGF